jgi:hypothetical protein
MQRNKVERAFGVDTDPSGKRLLGAEHISWFVLREKYCWLVADKPNEQGLSRACLTRLPCKLMQVLLYI